MFISGATQHTSFHKKGAWLVLYEQWRNIYSKTPPQQQKVGVILWRVLSGCAIDRSSYRGMSYSATRSSLSDNMSRIWRFNRKRKIAQSPYFASEAWTEWELALWPNVVPICNKTDNVRINVNFRPAPITTVAVEKQSECGFVALVFSIQRACAVLYCRLRPVSVYRILPFLSHEGQRFTERSYWTQNMFAINFFLISHSKKNSMRYHHESTRLHVKYPLFLV
jgi:hypothetical protein